MTAPSWETFANHVTQRLEDGAREYGDRSFGLPTPEVLAEIQQELLDVAAWGFVASGSCGETWRRDAGEWLRRGRSILERPQPMGFEPGGSLHRELLDASVRAYWLWRRMEILRERMMRERVGA